MVKVIDISKLYIFATITLAVVALSNCTLYGFVFADELKFVLPQDVQAPASTVKLDDAQNASAIKLKTSLEVSHDSYVQASSRYFGSDQKSSQIETVGAHFVKDQGLSQADAKFFYSAEEQTPYYDVAEISHEFKRQNYDLWVGRHREDWSQSDTFWRFGYWQPRFNFDPLHPTEDGLIGVFYEPKFNSSRVHVTLLASPLFDPETNASYHEENNNVVSQNPWFRNPPPIVQLWSQDTPVHMRIDMPSIEDIIFKPSGAAKIDVLEGDTARLHAAYAYKPMNTPVLGYSYFLRVQSDNTKYMDTSVEPMFDYHHIATIENPVSFGAVTITPSITYDCPQMTPVSDEWIAQDLAPSYIGSLTANYQIDGNRHHQVYGGVLHVWGDQPADRGENAQDTSQFALRPQYITALRVGYTTSQSSARAHNTRYTFEATYDPWQNGGQILNSYEYSFSKSWLTRARLDLIGIFSEPNDANSSAFFTSYRSNSVASMDVAYVF